MLENKEIVSGMWKGKLCDIGLYFVLILSKLIVYV